MKERKPPLRWRKKRRSVGLGQPQGAELWRGADQLAVVSPCPGGWYFCRGTKPGLPLMNTAVTPVASLELAKAEAEKWVRRHGG